MHVVWEKFCRYFDVEPRIIPLQPAQVHDRPGGRRAASSTRTRSASPPCWARRSPGTPTTSSGSTTCSCACATSAGSTSRCTSTAPAAASCGRSCTPTRRGTSGSSGALDQRVGAQVRARLPGLGWLVFRERSDLPEDLVFYENYLGKRDATFTLNFSTGAAHGARPVLQLRPLRARGLPRHHGDDAGQRARAGREDRRGHRRLRARRRARRRAASARRLQARGEAQLRRVRRRRRSSRPSAAGWCRPTRCPRTPST